MSQRAKPLPCVGFCKWLTRKVSCLEELAQQTVERHRGFFRGSAYEDDPVQACGLILMKDVGFVYEAKLLRTRTGRWLSLKEALSEDELKGRAQELVSRYTSAIAAWGQKRSREGAALMNAFVDGVEIANAMACGGRVAQLAADLLEREQLDPGAFRRACLEVRAAMVQDDIIRRAEAEASGGVVRTPEAERAAKEAAASSGSLVVAVQRGGRSLQGVTVIVTGGGTSASGRTDVNGRCAFAGLTRGSYRVVAISEGQRAESNAEVPGGGMSTSVSFDLSGQ